MCVCVCDCIGCQWDTVRVLCVVALAALEEMYSSLIKFAVNTYKCVCVCVRLLKLVVSECIPYSFLFPYTLLWHRD